MPTFREDIKLGTKVPLIKTDDISNNAVSEEKLSKAFRKKVDEIGEMTKEEMEDIVKSSVLINVGASLKKAKRKKVKQVLIGKAIKPTSVSRSDVENWYAFIENPCLAVKNTKEFKEKEPEVHLYIKRLGTDDGYQEIKISAGKIFDGGRLSKSFRILFPYNFKHVMYKVDRYQRNGYSHDIYLSYKNAPLTLRGQRPNDEWQNGERVCDKKIRKETIEDDLRNWLTSKSHLYNDLEYRRITSRRRTKHIRLLAKQYSFVKAKCRREVSWLLGAKQTKRELKSGLFKVRRKRNGYKTNWQTIYVRITKDKNDNDVLGGVTFK